MYNITVFLLVCTETAVPSCSSMCILNSVTWFFVLKHLPRSFITQVANYMRICCCAVRIIHKQLTQTKWLTWKRECELWISYQSQPVWLGSPLFHARMFWHLTQQFIVHREGVYTRLWLQFSHCIYHCPVTHTLPPELPSARKMITYMDVFFVFYGYGACFPNRNPIHFLWEYGKLQKYTVELLKFNKSSTDAAYAHLAAL